MLGSAYCVASLQSQTTTVAILHDGRTEVRSAISEHFNLERAKDQAKLACNWSSYTKLIEEAITERHSITMTTDSIQFCLNGQQISSITFNLNPY